MKAGNVSDDQKTFTLSNNYTCEMTRGLTFEGAATSTNDPIADSMTERCRASKSLNSDYLALDVKGKGTLYVVARAYTTSTSGNLRIGFQTNNNDYNVVTDNVVNTELVELKAEVAEAGTFFIYGTNVMTVQTIVWESDYDAGDETTGVRSMDNGDMRNGNHYYHNIAGQRVGTDYKGIVIVNGKKYLVK